MKAGLYPVVSVAGFILGAAVLAPAVIGLSFLSETLRRAPLAPLAQTLRWAAALVAFMPLLGACPSNPILTITNGAEVATLIVRTESQTSGAVRRLVKPYCATT